MNHLTQTRIVISGLIMLFLFFLAEFASLYGTGVVHKIAVSVYDFSSECLNSGATEACDKALALNRKVALASYLLVNFSLYTSIIFSVANLSFKKYQFKAATVSCLLLAILWLPFICQFLASASSLTTLIYRLFTIATGVLFTIKFIQHNQPKQARTPQSGVN